MVRELRERDIERQLVKRVKEVGGEVRKVKWVGRNGAPDRIVMLPAESVCEKGAWVIFRLSRTVWVELKRPGGKAKFPCDARERKQQREHARMHAVGQVVVIVDSFEGIEELLR